MSKNRSRIIYKNGFIIITNFKCGFSSINLLDNIVLDPEITDKSRVLFLFRKLYPRTISVFLNWAVRKAGEKTWFFDLLAQKTEKPIMDIFTSSITEEKLVESFKIFIKVLPEMYMHNQHLRPQSQILKNLRVHKIEEAFDLDDVEHMKRLGNILEQELPKINVSPKNQKEKLLAFLEDSDEFSKIVMEVYSSDIEFFSNHNINII